MLCDNCKLNEASVHFQQIINGKMSETHLCDRCASEKGMISLDITDSLSFGNLISGLLDEEEQGVGEEKNNKAVKVKCKCGWTNLDFKKTGYLGCPVCYKTFKKSLTPLLRSIHGNNKHIGKIPLKVPINEKVFIEKDVFEKDLKKLRKLKEDLQICIKEEKYEEAAKIRDEIKKLEKNIEDEQ